MNIQLSKKWPIKLAKSQIFTVFLAGVAILSFLMTVWLGGMLMSAPDGLTARGYRELKAGNGVRLHAVRASPEKISLKAIETNVTDDPEDGMNGGFFWEGQLLSIAVINDRPVKGAPGDYGSGWYNIDRPRGTLVWDGATGELSVQVTDRAEELAVTDRSRYWAQGGVSMGLHNERFWQEQALLEEFPVMDEKRLRSAIVYDTDRRLWLLLSDGPCTGPEFRAAIKETVAPGKLDDGIFLDGDGSSQLKLGQFKLPGDRRTVYQMITLPGG
ncbi:hypothetical protein [Paenibacillus sp. YN15]|uniref:hypothetical protein n=1 Tax=Paenibacillus sp. YN15 TaxID=1742774 RepID=UPI00215BC5F6|nr:hypothetical protein [Paenibacillus sp. YN15]